MAVSNSIDFSLTAIEILTEARKKIGVHASEESLSAAEKVDGLRVMNVMLKAWQADGVAMAHYTEGSLTLVQGDYDYTFATSGGDFTPVPFDIKTIRISRNSTEIPMTEMSRDEYYALPNRTNEGYPLQWFYDRQRDDGTLYIWPAPDATGGTLKITYVRRVMDVDANADAVDLPQEWYEAVIYGLASRLLDEYTIANPIIENRVRSRAGSAYETVKSFDIGEGEGSIFILPE